MPLRFVATEATTTPGVTNITLSRDQTAVRVFTGETPELESGFNLYVRKNSGAAYRVKLYRWQGRILTGAAGDSFAFGTDDGRTLQMAAMTMPAALVTPSGVTGLANCDKAGPPLWAPAKAHVTLPGPGKVFQIAAQPVERVVFISEYDGSNWSYPRFIWTQTNAAVNVQCTYSSVALANYDGVPLTVTAPEGSTVGGMSNCMTLGLPAVAGAIHTCRTAAEFLAAIRKAVAGDRIVLRPGTYALTTNIVAASFASNVAAGHVGAEGIQIVGATGKPDEVIITGAGGTAGYWRINEAMAKGTTYVQNVTFRFRDLAAGFRMDGGRWNLENVRFIGPGTNSALPQVYGASMPNGPFIATFLWCQSHNSVRDCFGFGGHAAHLTDSSIRLVGCSATNAGPTMDSQNLTTHFGMPLYVYGGHYGDTDQNFSANESDASPTYCNFITVTPGRRRCQMAHTSLYGCAVTTGTGGLAVLNHGYMEFCRVWLTNCAPLTGLMNGSMRNVTIAHNCFWNDNRNGRAYHQRLSSGWFIGNIVNGFATAVRVGDYHGPPVTRAWLVNNTITNCATAFDLHEDAAGCMIHLVNNVVAGDTVGISTTAAASREVLSSCNVVAGTISASYKPGPGDVRGTAVISHGFLPAAGANCDGTGQAHSLGWVGDSDPYGLVLFYSPTRSPRGAREIPALYPGALLAPDLW